MYIIIVMDSYLTIVISKFFVGVLEFFFFFQCHHQAEGEQGKRQGSKFSKRC